MAMTPLCCNESIIAELSSEQHEFPVYTVGSIQQCRLGWRKAGKVTDDVSDRLNGIDSAPVLVDSVTTKTSHLNTVATFLLQNLIDN